MLITLSARGLLASYVHDIMLFWYNDRSCHFVSKRKTVLANYSRKLTQKQGEQSSEPKKANQMNQIQENRIVGAILGKIKKKDRYAISRFRVYLVSFLLFSSFQLRLLLPMFRDIASTIALLSRYW